MSFFVYLLIIGTLDTAAILLARYYIDQKRFPIMLASLTAFALSGYVYVKMMGFAVTAVINIIYVAFSTVFITLVCYFFFKERVTLRQAIGILMVVIGISLLEL